MNSDKGYVLGNATRMPELERKKKKEKKNEREREEKKKWLRIKFRPTDLDVIGT